MPAESVPEIYGPFNLKGEVWKTIPGYEGRYEVSSFGQIKALPINRPRGQWPRFYKEKILKSHFCKKGYRYVGLTDHQGKPSSLQVHRLVLLAFTGPNPIDKPEARHMNGIPCDNRPENLRWGTRLEQSADQDRHGTRARGSRMPHAILTEEIVLSMRQDFANGISLLEISEKYKVRYRRVHKVCTWQVWPHVTV